jgi:hypothetical protein
LRRERPKFRLKLGEERIPALNADRHPRELESASHHCQTPAQMAFRFLWFWEVEPSLP